MEKLKKILGTVLRFTWVLVWSLLGILFRIIVACLYLITKLLEIGFKHLNKALELIILGDVHKIK